MKRLLQAMLPAVILALSWTTAPAQTEPAPSVDEIVNRTNQASYYQGGDGRAKVHMVITDDAGRAREREFVILRRDADEPGSSAPRQEQQYAGEQKFYVYFTRPADVNKMVFLVWKYLDKDDDRWLYMPALDLVKRIAASDKRTSFVGSTFYYEDVSGRNINADAHELAETTDNYYVLKNTPRDASSVEFAYYRMWIHKTTFLPVKIEYYDAQDKPYRTYQALDVKTIDGYPTVVKSRMSDTRLGSNTVMDYSDVKYDLGLPEDIFTERYLKQPPFQYLR